MISARICHTCNKRDVVIDDGCVICLFFRSDEEQERLKRIVHQIFDNIPESLLYSLEIQANMVYRALPYICTYKAQFRTEIQYFASKVIEETIEVCTIDVEEEESKPKTLRMWRAA